MVLTGVRFKATWVAPGLGQPAAKEAILFDVSAFHFPDYAQWLQKFSWSKTMK